MEYQIEVDFSANACRITYFPEEKFQHPGNSIDACNYRINQILENREHDITKSNLVGARIYVNDGQQVLNVNFRDRTLHLKMPPCNNLEDISFIKIL